LNCSRKEQCLTSEIYLLSKIKKRKEEKENEEESRRRRKHVYTPFFSSDFPVA
jgi:hypothetical protein